MGRVIFMMDYLLLKQAIYSNSSDRGQIGCLFRESKYLLEMGFIEYKVFFNHRTCNEPAHLLASLGSRLAPGGDRMWLTNLPLM